MHELIARGRYRLGERKRRVVSDLRARPLRVRPPLFSIPRECRRIVERHECLLTDPEIRLGEWESHQPVLVELLRRIPSPRVLELGIGYGSTPLVLGLSGSSVSLETAPSWFRHFSGSASDDHRILLWRDFSETEWDCAYLEQEWDVAFVDNAPAASRQSNLMKLAERARFVVCHDTEECFKPSAADYRWDFSSFRHVWTLTRFPNYTTVVSNVEPIALDHLGGASGQPPMPRNRT